MMHIESIGDGNYKVTYVVNHQQHSIEVDENAARMLERAKEAGREEKAAEIRKVLLMNY